ncbi:MAG TPA: phospholipase D-like domain-containing protein [Thermoanaerobaculia bacterium]|nr:phospholipase D-like domain-containing protein [Thermoanaerobaculia bacterium]
MCTPSAILRRVMDNSQLSARPDDEAANRNTREHDGPRCAGEEATTMTRLDGHAVCMALAELTATPIHHGTDLELLRDGGAYFPALLASVRRAEETVAVQVYRFHGGVTATNFADAFADRARAGVAVRVLIDDYGTGGMDRDLARLLADAGVSVRTYNPMTVQNALRLNQRNHRKLIAIDDTEAYIGGFNLDDVFSGSPEHPPWRENAVRIRGALVETIAASIDEAWSGARVGGARAVVPQCASSSLPHAQLLLSDHDHQRLRLALLHVLARARHSVNVSSAYFIPERDIAAALQSASRRGVHVRVLTAGAHNNIRVARLASHAVYGELLQDGVRIFEYRPAMLHAKTVTVDGMWCTVGSANLDACGLRFNLESQIATCDAGFVRAVSDSFSGDLLNADEVTAAAWQRRSIARRAGDHLARPLRFVL